MNSLLLQAIPFKSIASKMGYYLSHFKCFVKGDHTIKPFICNLKIQIYPSQNQY